MWVRFLSQEDLLEEGMATHSSILAWRIPWTEEPGGLQSIRVSKSQTCTGGRLFTIWATSLVLSYSSLCPIDFCCCSTPVYIAHILFFFFFCQMMPLWLELHNNTSFSYLSLKSLGFSWHFLVRGSTHHNIRKTCDHMKPPFFPHFFLESGDCVHVPM